MQKDHRELQKASVRGVCAAAPEESDREDLKKSDQRSIPEG